MTELMILGVTGWILFVLGVISLVQRPPEHCDKCGRRFDDHVKESRHSDSDNVICQDCHFKKSASEAINNGKR